MIRYCNCVFGEAKVMRKITTLLIIFLFIFIGLLSGCSQQQQSNQQYYQKPRITRDWYLIFAPDCAVLSDIPLDGPYTYSFDVDQYASAWKIKIRSTSPGDMNVEIYYGNNIDSNSLFDTAASANGWFEKEYPISLGDLFSFTIFNKGCDVEITLIQYTDFGGSIAPCGTPIPYIG